MLHETVSLPYASWSWPRHLRAKWIVPFSNWVFHRATANIFELDNLAAQAALGGNEELPEGYTFRLAQAEDLAACAEMANFFPEIYRQRFEAGDECYVVYAGSVPVNLTWLHFGPCYVRGMGLRLDAPQSDCYLYNVVTDRQCRGKGLYKITQRKIIRLLAERGIARIRQLVMLDNAVPHATLPKLGYRLVEQIRHRHVLGVSLTTIIGLPSGSRRWRLLLRRPGNVFHI